MSSDCVSPAAQEHVIGPYHGQRQQPVQTVTGRSWLHGREVLQISQDKLSPGTPLFAGFAVAPEGVNPLGQLRVLGQIFGNNVFIAPLPRHPCNYKENVRYNKRGTSAVPQREWHRS